MKRTLAILAVAGVGTACGGPPANLSPDAGLEEPRNWRDEVVYQLLTDRFAQTGVDGVDCPRCYQGGDFRGIEDRLDYLDALGVTTLWISPVAQNVDDVIGDGYHGFWTLALDQVNPRFGTEGELVSLVDRCHQRGMKVIVDVVLNHMGPVFFYDLDGDGQLDDGELTPPYQSTPYDVPMVFTASVSPATFTNLSWYHRRGVIGDFDDPEEAQYGDFLGGLRDLDTANPEVRLALLQVTLDWLDRVPFDGIRFDAAKHVDAGFWPWFLAELRAARPGLFTVAEVFDGDVQRLASYTEDGGFDSVLDFSAKYRAFEAVFAGTAATAELEALHVAQRAGFFDEAQVGGAGSAPRDLLLRFLDNHDLPRFLGGVEEAGRLHAALAYLLLGDGVPTLYYGTEQDFSGGEDPANREALWTSGYDTQGETFVWIAQLIRARKVHRALRRGDLRFVWTSERTEPGDGAGVVAFERILADERLLVVVNTRATPATTSAAGVAMQVGFAPGTRLVNDLGSGAELEVPSSGRLAIELGAYETRLYVSAP